MKLIRSIIPPFLDRCFNLFFYRGKCYKLIFYGDTIGHNDIIDTGNGYYRGLGRDWYKEFKIDKRL